MKHGRFSLATALALAASLALAQGWSESYQKGLDAASKNDYAAAKAAFAEAVALRPEDQSASTILPGSITEPQRWRGGAPYSPNFAIGYLTYKEAMAAPAEQKSALFTQAVTVFETLANKGQGSAPTYYFLNLSYGGLGQIDKQRALEAKLKESGGLPWKVDTAVVTPEDVAAVNETTMVRTPDNAIIKAGADTTPQGQVPIKGGTSTVAVRVPTVATKFAFIVGNSEGKIAAGKIPYAMADAQLIRESLVQSAGYDDGNVDTVLNGTSEQIMIAAKALAERMPDDATLFIFFAGVGANVDGKDYYAGIDAALPNETGKMVSKVALYQIFLNKGARIFAFHEAARPIVGGRYFGMEEPLVGRIAQSHATIPGSEVYSIFANGKEVGIYAKALADTISLMRSNSIPVMEFGWQVFNSIRGGSPGVDGGRSRQIPTLPGVFNMAPEEKF